MTKETLFPVKEVTAILGKEFNYKDNTGWKFIVREDTENIISCVTDKYKMITNQQVIDAASPILNEIGATLTEEKSFANGARSNWTWKIPDIKVKIDNKDYVNPTLTLRNSYDGSVQLHILAGAFRLVCSNELVLLLVIKSINIQSIILI